jgi:hypothetical protein
MPHSAITSPKVRLSRKDANLPEPRSIRLAKHPASVRMRRIQVDREEYQSEGLIDGPLTRI